MQRLICRAVLPTPWIHNIRPEALRCDGLHQREPVVASVDNGIEVLRVLFGAHVRELSCVQLIHRDAQGVYVALSRVVVFLEQLRRHVLKGPHNLFEARAWTVRFEDGVANFKKLFLVFGDAKVCQPRDGVVPEQQVVGLDVAVNNARLVQRGNRPREVERVENDKLQPLVNWDEANVHELVETPVSHPGQDVRVVRWALADGEGAKDVGLVEPEHDLQLLVESVEAPFVGDLDLLHNHRRGGAGLRIVSVGRVDDAPRGFAEHRLSRVELAHARDVAVHFHRAHASAHARTRAHTRPRTHARTHWRASPLSP
mmetsp:Transcript_29510/g.71904  ORF Transcript_29510/g.71904 Transcript_29510/m.71904 type:complete len:313 (+) Transcript_29510:1369-2307(+)